MLDVEGVLTVEGSGSMGDATAPWDAYHDQIKTVVIAEGVTSIAPSAFSGCSALTDLTMPVSVCFAAGHDAKWNLGGQAACNGAVFAADTYERSSTEIRLFYQSICL